jgi:DDE superfamily endonuclease
MDRATQVLAQGVPAGVPKSFRALADHGDIPRTTLQHRARGRQSIEEKAQTQQYLYPWEAKALVKFLIHQDALGRSVQIKYVRSIAWTLARQRPPSDRPSKPPGRNWPRFFYKRHPALEGSRKGALDWNRYEIYDKVVHWFDVIGKVLQDPAVLQDNVYNMDETVIMLSKLNSVKVIVGKENKNRSSRGARVKRVTITAIECVSASGRYLNPMIIWPAATHRANWTTHPTPGWHYAFSDSGYTDSFISLQWLKLVFDPQTKERANKKPRVLICDGFGTHETLEILEFCFENNILLCRLPSHTSHVLQPCDISVFGPLKTAYRSQLE